MKTYNLHRARAAKNDEFYTQYSDIEKECSNYMGHFFNKIIYCNCDTADSNFVKYFQELKRCGKIKDVFYSGGLGGVDFRSPESIELLKQADIVVSNPPFSLFREYIAQLVEHDKKFLIIGSQNAITYNIVFNLIKTGKVFVGYTYPRSFIHSSGQLKKFGNICWFTNISPNGKEINLEKSYYTDPNKYLVYDNAAVINVNKVSEIPFDYNSVMGVPITFINSYNSKQFNIHGLDKDYTLDKCRCSLNGKRVYARVFISRNKILRNNAG